MFHHYVPCAVKQVHHDHYSGDVSGFSESERFFEDASFVKLVELSWNIESWKIEHAVFNGETLFDGGDFVLRDASTHYSFDVGSVLGFVNFGKWSDFFENAIYFDSPEDLFRFIILRWHFLKSVVKN